MKKHFFNRFVFGLGLIVTGVLFLLQQTGQINLDISEIASTYWPLIIIYFCLQGLLTMRRNSQGWSSSMIWNLIGIGIGLYFLGRNMGFIHLSIGELVPYIIPVLLIIFGLNIMFKPRKVKSNTDFNTDPDLNMEWSSTSKQADPDTFDKSYKDETYNSTNTINKSNFIGDVYLGQDFWELQPLNVSHFIGDTVVDLTKAQIAYGETKIMVSAFIGDVKIFVPNDIELEVSVTFSSFIGDSHVFDRKEGGMLSNMKYEPKDYQIAEKRIRIIVSMFIGDLKIQRIG